MRVARFATLAKDVGERRIDENCQQLTELLAAHVSCRLRRIVAPGYRTADAPTNASAMPPGTGWLSWISGDEQEARLMRPDHASGDTLRMCRGDRRAGASGWRSSSRWCHSVRRALRELERQQRELRCRERQAKMNEDPPLIGIDRKLTGRPGTKPRIRPCRRDVVKHGKPIARIDPSL